MNIISFSDSAALNSSVSGGKGSSLARLSGAGFNVPEGFIVPAEMYTQWVQSFDLAALLGDLPENDPAGLAAACERLQKRLAQIPLPEGLAGEALALTAGFDSLWAVRSSATTEDLAQAAFAGQHETFLGCRPEDIAGRVRDCWISLWSDRAVDYRRRAGFAVQAADMAVVIQRLIESEAAGVGFSLDPVSGRADRLVFEANYGLGESVVSGETETDQYVLAKADLSLVSCRVGHKEKRMSSEGAAARWVKVAPELRDQSVLSEARLRELGDLLKRVEEFYGHPVDTEWAFQGGLLYLLQARPVTRIPARWTRDESAERFPNAVTPLTWDFVSRGFHLSLNHSLALMGLPPYQDQWFAIFDNYIYGNQNAVELYAERLPFTLSSLDDFVAQIPALLERYAWVWDLPVDWARNLDRYLMRLGRLDSRISTAGSLADLWPLVLELQKTGEEYFLPNIAISITQRNLHRLTFLLLKWLTGPQALEHMDAVMRGCETKTGAVNRDLLALAEAAAGRPRLAEALLASEPRAFLAGGLALDPEWERRFKLFLEDHGHREVDYDPYVPTWGEAPHHVLGHIQAILARLSEAAEGQSPEKPRVIASRAEEDLLAAAPENLRVTLRELIRLTRIYTALDDLEHYQTTRLYPPFRRLMVKIGGLLAGRGLIEEPADIFFARLDELGRAIREDCPEILSAPVAAEKKRHYEHSQQTPAWVLGEDEGQTLSGDESILQGLAGSPGEAVGEVFIVHSPDDFARFPEGAILAARTTNPAWTPLFYKARAVITESGGPLSHGAVTAREMGLPAVMAVRDLLRRLSNGQQVKVLGHKGLVELL